MNTPIPLDRSAACSARGLQALCLAVALTGLSAQAQLLSSEPFAGYTVGTQLPANIPSPTISGYTGDWTGVDYGTARPQTIAGSLSYTGAGYAAGLGDRIGVLSDTTGGEITAANSARMYRLLDSSLTVNSSTAGTIYLSWLFQSGQETGATTYQMLDLYNTSTADANRTFTAGLTMNGGNSGSQYDFGVNEAYTSTGVAADTAVHLFVVKFVLSATASSDSVTVWIDPTLGAGEPAGGFTVSAQDIAFDRLAISDYDGNSANWDEIRWGTTFDNVTTVAPPVAPTVVAVANPSSATVNQAFTITATVTPGGGTVTNVSVDLTQIGGSAAASLVLSNGNVYTNTFTVPGSATIGAKTLAISAKDTTPLIGSYLLSFTVLPTSRTWDGGSLLDSKWSSVTNWVGEVGPATPSDTVTFAGTTRLTPDMDANYSIAGLTFDSTAGSFNIGTSTGGTLTNGVGGIVNNSANAQVLNLPVVLGVAQTFSTAPGNLTLSNTVTGGVGLTKAGAGTLTFAGSGASSIGDFVVTNGSVKITAGTVQVNATQGNTKFDLGASVEVSTSGVLNITNGVNSWFPVGDTAGTTNTLTLSGGTVTVRDNWGMEVPRQGTGVLNVNSGSITVNDIGGVGLIIGDMGTAESGTVNLNGGTLAANKITSANGVNAIYMNGGTLSPTASRTDFLNNAATLSVEVRNGGAVVDTAGFNISIGEYLAHSTVGGDNALDGGLTKIGNGTLTLSGGYTYTGPTKVLGGTLSLNPSLGVPSPAGDVVVSNATLTVDASSGVALPAGNVVLGPGAALNITAYPYAYSVDGTGNLTFGTNTTINLNYGTVSANPSAAAINVAGTFSAPATPGSNIVINITAGGLSTGVIPLITTTGTASTNGFVLGTKPAGIQAVLTNNTPGSVDLLITSAGQILSWHGANFDSSLLLTNWDINTSSNWYDQSFNSVKYLQYAGNTFGDNVVFGDNGYNTDLTNHVNLSATVVPASVTFSSTAYPYTLTGAGGIGGVAALVLTNNSQTIYLATSNSYTGGTVIAGGTLAITNDSALGASSGPLTLGGGTLQMAGSVASIRSVTLNANSSLEVLTNVTAQMTGSVTGGGGLIAAGDGALTLSGNISSAGLTKNGNGTLTLSGTNTLSGNLAVNAGKVNLASSVTAIPGGGNPNITVGSAGVRAVVQLTGTSALSSTNTGKFVRLGTQGGIGIISNGPNSLLSFNTFGIGFGNTGASSAGAIYNFGTFTNLSGDYLANADNAYGYFRSGGTAYFGDNVHITHNDTTLVNGGTALMDLTGGTAAKNGTGTFWLNDQNRTYTGAAANAGLNITGGTLTFTGTSYQWNINNGVNNYASVNITGGGLIAMTGDAGFGLGRNNNAANRETFTLANGGTLQGSYIFTTAASSSPVFTFNNGTYRASAANGTGLIQSGILAYVQSGGAIIDTAGQNPKMPVALLAPTGNGVTNIVLGGTTTGYMGAPVVKIVGDGVGAAAIASFDPATGTIIGITVTSPGSGYTTATVTLEGGSGTPGSGQTAGTATATAQLGPVSTGGLTKIGAGTLFLNATNTYTGTTVVSNGALGGIGTIAGPVVVTSAGALAPGASIGTLTISNNLALAGNLSIEVNSTNAQNSDLCVVIGTLTNSGSGTVTVTNLGPALALGNSFQLFSKAVVGGGSLNITGGNLGSGLGWTNKLTADGTIAVIAAGATNPTNITFSVSGGNLNLSWPSDHLGWTLQMQTNNLGVGLSTNWVDVPGSSGVIATNFPVNSTVPTVFYRLRN